MNGCSTLLMFLVRGLSMFYSICSCYNVFAPSIRLASTSMRYRSHYLGRLGFSGCFKSTIIRALPIYSKISGSVWRMTPGEV